MNEKDINCRFMTPYECDWVWGQASVMKNGGIQVIIEYYVMCTADRVSFPHFYPDCKLFYGDQLLRFTCKPDDPRLDMYESNEALDKALWKPEREARKKAARDE